MNRSLERFLLTAAAGLLLATSRLSAAGTTAADFLKVGAGVRPAGMAGAFVAVSDETSGMLANPAGLAFLSSPEIQTAYGMWLADTYYGFAGYAHPTFSGTYGLGLQYFSAPATDRIVNGVRNGSFSYYDAAATAHYSFRLGEHAGFGLNCRGIQSSIDTDQKTAFTGDAGLMLRTPEEGFSFGVAGQNLFGALGDDKLPACYRAGMAFKVSMPEQLTDVLLSLEAGQEGGGPLYYAAGLEHWGAGVLGLRAGYRYIADEKQRQSMNVLEPWSAGLSLRIKSLAIDYAYKPFAELGQTHRISLSWRLFGFGQRWRSVAAELKAEPAVFSPNNDGAKDSVFLVPGAREIKNVRSWELDVRVGTATVVYQAAGKDALPKILTWEGQTIGGGIAAEGEYTCLLTVEGAGRKRGISQPQPLTVDYTLPKASLELSNTVISPNNDGLEDGVTFYVSAGDPVGIDQWQLSIFNERKKTVKIFKSTQSAPVDIYWNGEDDYYGSVVPNADYEVRLTAIDNAGNRTKVSRALSVNVPPRVEVREVIKEVVKEVAVKQEVRGLVVNLSSQVLFAVGKSALKPAAFRALDEVVNLLQSYPENKVLIEGYTDSTGSRQRNIAISSERAWAVYSYLAKHGVDVKRLTPKGFGPDNPIASNRTASGRSQNRRVSIIILKNAPAPDALPH